MNDDGELPNLLPKRRTTAIDLRQLQYAISAAEYGSFRRAAHAMRLRQSTLSRRIRRLEEATGVTLFERSSGGVRATLAGRAFLGTAHSILEQLDTLMTSVHRSGHGQTGRLAIGFYTSLSSGNLRATLQTFARRYPQIEIDLIESSRTRLMTALRSRVLDVAIIPGEAPFPDGMTTALWSERVLVVLPREHPLAANDVIYWTELKDETALLSRRDPGPAFHDLLVAKLVSPANRPKIVHHDVSGGCIMNLVSAGRGISLVTEADVDDRAGGLVCRDVRDGGGSSWLAYSAHWRGGNDNPTLANFLKLLAERYPVTAMATDRRDVSWRTPDRSP